MCTAICRESKTRASSRENRVKKSFPSYRGSAPTERNCFFRHGEFPTEPNSRAGASIDESRGNATPRRKRRGVRGDETPTTARQTNRKRFHVEGKRERKKSPRPRTHRSFSSFLVRLAPALRARRAMRLGAFVRLHRRQRRAPRRHERLVRVVFKGVFENVLRVREASVVGLGRAVGGRRGRRGGARSAVAGCPGRDARAGGGIAETAVRREDRGDASRVTHRRRDGRGSRRVGARHRRGVLRVRARRCGGGEREGAHFGGFGARSRPDPRREAHQATPRGGRAGTRRTTEPRPRVPSSRYARAEVRRATSSRRPPQMQQANRVARG